jgi:hypothetical protein
MKKIIIALIAVLIMLPAYSFAQKGYAIDKGVMLLAGSISFTSEGGDLRGDERATTFTINPAVGYFVIPHLAIGVGFNYTKYSYGDDDDTFLGIGPAAAYFLGDANSKMYPFVGASFVYGSVSDSYTKTDIKFEVGSAYMIAKNVAITGSAFYMLESYKPEGADESTSGNTFGIEFGVSTFIY